MLSCKLEILGIDFLDLHLLSMQEGVPFPWHSSLASNLDDVNKHILMVYIADDLGINQNILISVGSVVSAATAIAAEPITPPILPKTSLLFIFLSFQNGLLYHPILDYTHCSPLVSSQE
jgi:hypothetical protein